MQSYNRSNPPQDRSIPNPYPFATQTQNYQTVLNQNIQYSRTNAVASQIPQTPQVDWTSFEHRNKIVEKITKHLREAEPSRNPDYLHQLAKRFEEKIFNECNNNQETYLRFISQKLLNLKNPGSHLTQSIGVPQTANAPHTINLPTSNPVPIRATMAFPSSNSSIGIQSGSISAGNQVVDDETKYWQKHSAMHQKYNKSLTTIIEKIKEKLQIFQGDAKQREALVTMHEKLEQISKVLQQNQKTKKIVNITEELNFLDLAEKQIVQWLKSASRKPQQSQLGQWTSNQSLRSVPPLPNQQPPQVPIQQPNPYPNPQPSQVPNQQPNPQPSQVLNQQPSQVPIQQANQSPQQPNQSSQQTNQPSQVPIQQPNQPNQPPIQQSIQASNKRKEPEPSTDTPLNNPPTVQTTATSNAPATQCFLEKIQSLQNETGAVDLHPIALSLAQVEGTGPLAKSFKYIDYGQSESSLWQNEPNSKRPKCDDSLTTQGPIKYIGYEVFDQ